MKLTPQHLALIDAYKTTCTRIDELEELKAHLKGQVIDALGDEEEGTDPATGKAVIRNAAQRKFDLRRALSLVPASVAYDSILVPDPKLVKAALTGDQVESCMVLSGTRRFQVAQ